MKLFFYLSRLSVLLPLLAGSSQMLQANMKNFKGKVRTGYEYDSNVLELGTGNEVASRLAMLGWSGTYTPYEKKGEFLLFSFQGLSKIPLKSDRTAFNVGSLFIQQGDIKLQKSISPEIAVGGDFNLRFRFISGKTGAILLQQDSYLLADYRPYMRFHLTPHLQVTSSYTHSSLQFKRQAIFNYASDGIGVSLDRRFSKKLSALLGYHFDVYRFRIPIMEGPNSARQRDLSHRIKAGLEHYQILLSRIEVGYEGNKSNRLDSSFNFDNYQINVVLAKTFPRDLSVNIQYAYNIKTYSQKSGTQINPLELREKNFNILAMGISKSLNSSLEVDFKYSHVSNRTNVSCLVDPQCLNFTKNLFSLTLGYRYGSK